MPLNGSDVASKPSGTIAVADTTIESAKYNSVIDDLYSILNTVRTIAKGFTGASTAQGAVDNFFLTGTTVNDDALLLVDPADDTKKVRLDAGSVTAGNTRVLTMADADVDLADLAPKASPSFTGNVTTESTDAGATAGPDLDLYRNSASPAASDILGRLLFNGEDSAGNKELYAYLRALIGDPTSTSEDAALEAFTVVAGTLARRLVIGAGMYMDGATGGDKGAGTVNATEIYKNGTAIGIVQSAAIATTSGTSIDFEDIPSWAKRITIVLSDVSTSGTSNIVTLIGAGGVADQTNYSGATFNAAAAVTTSGGALMTSGSTLASTSVLSAVITLLLVDASTNTWAIESKCGDKTAAQVHSAVYTKSLSGALDIVRIAPSNGTDTFDAGKARITWES